MAKRYLILGAGASGLSLCHALLAHGVTDDIVILDRKTAFPDDRTWCFWSRSRHPFSSLASQFWHRWDVVGADGARASQASESGGYACLRGGDFYAHVLDVIRRHPNVTLKLGCPAEGHPESADYIFDSRPRPLSAGGLTLEQRFFGQFIHAGAPVFDPARCTLMDFRTSQDRGLHFLYVLPTSPTEALVENTYIQSRGTRALTPEQHRLEIRAYLDRHYGLTAFRAGREEAGIIPMTTQPFPKREGRTFFIGTAGGCTRPSSGYTFARIQEQCRQIAEAASAGALDAFRETPPPWRYRFFDTVFLQAMADRPEDFPEHFHRLFSRVPPDALTGFLSESSTWRSDLQIIRSLPFGPLLRAAVKSAPLWLAPRP